MSSEVRVRVLVSGRVQGVFFRAYTRDMAESRGLRGWVRNLPDGRVEAVFSGPQEVVDKAIAWCHKGSPSARVDKVETTWEAAAGGLKGFEVRY